MERSNPDGIVEGPRLDELRARHPEFMRQMLVFGCDREATRSDLAATYAGWRGMERDSRGFCIIPAMTFTISLLWSGRSPV